MRCVLFAFLCLLNAGNLAMAASLTPRDFAFGCSLPVADEAGIYALDLPLAVYENSVQTGLGDLRVFNGAGETVPHAVRRISQENRQTRQTVPFFPLPGARQHQTTDLSLQVVRNAAGAVVTVDAGTIATAQPQSSSYLLDTTQLEAKLTELELQWRSPASILTVSLAQSSDLAHWSPLVDKAVLAKLTYNGGTVTSRRIPLPSKTLSYIRLDCVDCREPVQLLEVTALSGLPAAADQWQWVRLNDMQSSEDRGERVVEYHLTAKIPVSAMQLRFPAANSLLRAAIETRATTSDSWRHLAQADFYRLDLQGNSLLNPLVYCPPHWAPYWRIRITSDNAGLEGKAQTPQLELGWRPEQLIFLGRGSGPYTLAFGSAKAAAIDTAQNDSLVLAALRDSKAESHIRQVKPGPLQTLGGEQALKPSLSTFSWKTILLWIILVAGVVVLALMTRSIAREMQKK